MRENGPFSGQEHDEDDKSKKPRRRSDAFMASLRRLISVPQEQHYRSSEEDDDDDDDDEKSEKKGLWARFTRFRKSGFSRLFKSRIAEVTPVASDQSEAKGQAATSDKSTEAMARPVEGMAMVDPNEGHEDVYPIQGSYENQSNQQPRAAEHDGRESPEGQAPHLDDAEQVGEQRQQSAARNPNALPEHSPPPEGSNSSLHDPDGESSAERAANHQQVPATPVYPMPNRPDAYLYDQQRRTEAGGQLDGGVAFDRSQPAMSPLERERIIERRSSGGAAAAFIGAEILSRRRDRELRRKDRELEREISSVKHEQQSDRTIVQELERRNAIARENLKAARGDNLAPETNVGSPPQSQEVRIDRTESRPQHIEQSVAVPLYTRDTLPRPIHMEEAPPAPRFEATKESPQTPEQQGMKQPEYVLKQVEAAAERDLPMEKFYERRHELKDDPSGVPQGGSSGPARVGTVLQDMSQQDHKLAAMMQQVQQSAPPSRSGPLNNPTYRRAVAAGAGGGLVILVMLALMLLFS